MRRVIGLVGLLLSCDGAVGKGGDAGADGGAGGADAGADGGADGAADGGGAEDECLVDNGGCGDPALWRCADTPEAAPTCTFLCEVDHAAIFDGVTGVDLGGSLPSALVLHGQASCPLIVDGGGLSLAGAGRFGAGRFAHLGHEGLLSGGVGSDAGAFAGNLLRWAAGDGRRAAVEPGLGGVARALEDAGFEVVELGGGAGLAEGLAGVDLFVTTSYSIGGADEAEAIVAFVEAGGGLVSGGHAWWWAYSSGEDPALAYPGNAWLGPLGLTITADTATGGAHAVDAAAPPSDLLHHRRALDLVLAHLSGEAPLDSADQRTGAATVGFAVTALPLSMDAWFAPLRAALATLPEPVVPTEAAPVRPDRQPIEALVLRVESKLATEGVGDQLIVPASAADFPGALPEGAARGTMRVSLTPAFDGYGSQYLYSGAGEALLLSTGAWAPAGEEVGVTIPAAWRGAGLSVQIGAFTDTLWHLGDWWRNPEITRRAPLADGTTAVASGFGGLVYLVVPAGVDLPAAELELSGVVEAPRFVRGETDPAAWAASRAAPAPWAELEGEHLILTVPSDGVRGLDDPEALMALWDEVMEAEAALADMALPRARKERIQLDRQISAGWMHSGYPIMAYTAVTAELTELELLQAQGSWGAFHELGHNHQHRSVELSGTTEATVNLWSVYAMEEALGIDRGAAHPALAPADRASRVDAYLAGGRDYAGSWSVWTALETYLQVQERFGWAPFIALHRRSNADPSPPATEQERLDQQALWLSEECGMDLTGFFGAWGWPLSPGVAGGLAHLPDWTDHPLAGR